MHFQKVPKLAENSLLNTSKGINDIIMKNTTAVNNAFIMEN